MLIRNHPHSDTFHGTAEKLFLLLILGITLCLFAGCAPPLQSVQPAVTYTLHYEPQPINERLPLPASIRVVSFGTAPEYQTDNIVYQPEPFIRNSYPYHRWLSSPAELVRYFLERDMKKSGLYQAVAPPSSRYQATYSLGGTVEDFLEIDEEQQWFARLSLNIILQELSNSKSSSHILLQKSYSISTPCTEKTPGALVKAMSMAMSDLSRQIQLDTYEILAENLKKDM
jgi:ABC-type uncharacterized transport system auxiliary subunit